MAFERVASAVASVHAVAGFAWLVGALLSPPLEGIAFAVMAPAALCRWRNFVETVARRDRFSVAILAYIALISWVYLSIGWAPNDAQPDRYVRHMIAPLMLVHAGLRFRDVRAAAIVGGGSRALVAVAELAGISLPGFMVIDHPSKATLGLQLLGVACASLLPDPKMWRRGLLPLWMTALWIAGALQLASRGTVLAGVAGGTVGIAARCRSVKSIILVTGVALALLAAIVFASKSSPLMSKTIAQMQTATNANDGPTTLASEALVRADKFLSLRGTIWGWTLSSCRTHPLCGNGFGSWPTEFNKSLQAGEVRVLGTGVSLEPTNRMSHAHSLYLQVLYEQGLFGLLLLLATVVAALRCAGRANNAAAAIFATSLLVTMLVIRLSDGGQLCSRASSAAIAFLVCSAGNAARSEQRDGIANGPDAPTGRRSP